MATNEKAINLETLGAFKDEADKAYQAKLTAGENITISEDNVISASGGGMSTVNTAEPISGDGSVENPITADTFDVDYQQITHDDSLVHVSNNAQYALGVNLPMFRNWIDVTNEITLSSTYVGSDYSKFIYNPTLNEFRILGSLTFKNTTSGTTYELATLPEKYRPIIRDYESNFTGSDNASYTRLYIRIYRETGKVTFSVTKTGTYFMPVISYACKGGN